MNDVLIAMKKVFVSPGYVVLALSIAVAILVLAIWLPNLSFLASVAVAHTLSLSQKTGIFLSSLSALGTNFTVLSRALTIILSLLVGVNIALLIFYMRTRFRLERSAGVSFGGILLGLLGVGCASCGSIILSAFLGVGATASFVTILPLKGQEFGFLGVAFMLFAIWLAARKIEQPLTCAVVE
ncbi:MAG: hypothetical protein KGI73_00935 [Patescibacteria group bacterium]|nr:hypothetical protein [Patescibacteria group bacterium]